MAASSMFKLVLLVVTLHGVCEAGQIPSCEQQIYNSIQASVNVAAFSPSCIHRAIPSLNNHPGLQQLLGGGGGGSGGGGDTCIANVDSLQSVIAVLTTYLRQNSALCGVNFNTLPLSAAVIQLDLLGILNLGINVGSVRLQGFNNLSTNVSLVALSPTVLKVDVRIPLIILTQIQTGLNVGLLGLGLNVNVNVNVQATARISCLVTIGAGGAVNVQVVASTVSVNDYDYPTGGLSGLLNLGGTLSVVATVVTGLVNAVGTLLGNVLASLIGGCLGCVTC